MPDPSALPVLPVPEPPSHPYAVWLAGQSVAVIIQAVWIWTLLRDRTTSATWIKELSALLLQSTENGWRDRWKEKDDALLKLDSAQRNLLEAFTSIVRRPRG
jgi:hypothetical protein